MENTAEPIIEIKNGQSVNFHNFSRIFKKENHLVVKIIWVMIFLGLFAATNFILITITLDYFEYKVV